MRKYGAGLNKQGMVWEACKSSICYDKKLKCGYCGHSMNGESGTSKSGTKVYYYKCCGRKRHIADCNKSVIRKEELENLVLDTTIQALREPRMMSEIINGILAAQEIYYKENSNLTLLMSQKRQVDTALNNLIAAIERGIISNTTNKRLHELERQQEELERQILIERSKAAVMLTENQIQEFYKQASKLEPKLLIDYVIKEIEVFDEHIDIYFNSPIKRSPDDDSQGFSFYSKIAILVGQEVRLKLYV